MPIAKGCFRDTHDHECMHKTWSISSQIKLHHRGESVFFGDTSHKGNSHFRRCPTPAHTLAALKGLRGIFLLREREIKRECDTKAEVEIVEVQGFTQEGSREIQNVFILKMLYTQNVFMNLNKRKLLTLS